MRFDLYRDARNEWRWTLYADNHKKIADSGEGYKNKGDCIDGIRLVQASALAPINERPANTLGSIFGRLNE